MFFAANLGGVSTCWPKAAILKVFLATSLCKYSSNAHRGAEHVGQIFNEGSYAEREYFIYNINDCSIGWSGIGIGANCLL